MFNFERTKEVFGYELSLQRVRRTNAEVTNTNGIKPRNLLVIDNCPSCGIERTIKLNQSRKNKSCSKCFHATPEMMEAKHNQKKEKSEEHKQKMRDNHWSKHGGISAFKGKQHTEEVKKTLSDKTKDFLDGLSEETKHDRYVKSSCTLRGIEVEDFTGWSTEENIRIRGSAEYKEWEKAVHKRDNKCQFPGCLERRKSELIAHHKDGFSWCKERRFNISNGILLCKFHHTDGAISYHRTHGTHNSTEVKFLEWIQKYQMPEQKSKIIYIVTGAPGSGKSWVCDQLANNYTYISYDDFPKESHLQLIFSDNSGKPILYDPWRKATSFVKRYSDSLDIRLIVIKETREIVRERILNRGGTLTDKIDKYTDRAFNISKNAFFSGTSSEVLNFLKSII